MASRDTPPTTRNAASGRADAATPPGDGAKLEHGALEHGARSHEAICGGASTGRAASTRAGTAVLPGDADGGRTASALGLAVWAGFIAVVFGVGALLRRSGELPVDPVGPLHASARLMISPLAPAAAVGLAAVAVLPVAARRLPWHALLGAAWLASVAWAVALQWPDGIARPLTAPTEYLAGLPAMGDDPLGWLRGFTRHLQEYPTHVKGHPPLPMMILWTMRWTGLEGAGWAAALTIAAGTSATAAIAVTLRTLTDETTARRAIPFLVLSPTAIWVATSMDALFLAIAAWAATCTALASTRGGGNGPRPPWGTIPLPYLRPVDGGGNWFHRLWITLSFSTRGASSGGGSGKMSTGRRVGTEPAGRAAGTEAAGSRAGMEATGSRAGTEAAHRLAGTDCTGAVVGAAGTGPVTGTGSVGDSAVAAFGYGRGVSGRTAISGESFRRVAELLLGFVGGVLLGALPYLSYGLLSFSALPLAVLLLTRPRRTVVGAIVVGCPVVPVAATAAGFSWWDGMVATHAAWAAGAGARRPYAFFLVGDLGVLALVVGPATAVAVALVLGRMRGAVDTEDSASEHRGVGTRLPAVESTGGRLGVLIGAAFAGVLALDLSGVTRGEVERIWLPYAAWMTVAGAVYRRPARGLLLAQAVTALLIQGLVRSPW